jgi:hypothetical protein
MTVTLDQVLLLAGTLDDAAGFDSARERFRRFLLDHATHPDRAVELIEQCQHAPGDQHQRALQDLVALLGRFLGFDVVFAAPADAGPPPRAMWRSRSRLRVILDLRSDQTAGAGFDGTLQAVAAATANASPGVRLMVLCVLAPPGLGRGRLDAAKAEAGAPVPIATVSLRALAKLAAVSDSGRLGHDDVVRLLESGAPLDFMADLLGRAETGEDAAAALDAAPEPGREPSPIADDGQARFWLATVAPDQGMKPAEVLETVVQKRLIFGVTDDHGAGRVAQPGEWLCFHLPGRGVVGHARVAALARQGGGLRAAHRFKHLLHLDHLVLSIDAPSALDVETQLRLTAARALWARDAQALLEISRESYVALTRPALETIAPSTARS